MPCTFDTVRKIAAAFDHVEEGTSYGTAALKVRGKLFARLKEDNDSLVLAMDVEQRENLIAEDPVTYYITDHYVKYPWILVRLSRVRPDALRDLLRGAHRFAAAGKADTGLRRKKR